MNFYMAESFSNIDYSDYNIEFSDTMLDFLHQYSKKFHIDMSVLFEIDPYDDVLIETSKLLELYELCCFILENRIMDEYQEKEEVESFEKLCQMICEANCRGLNIISIGD